MDVDGVALVAGAGNPNTIHGIFPKLMTPNVGSGVGRQVALALSSRGISTIVCADLNEEAARKTASECLLVKPTEVPDLSANVIQFDVTDEDSVQRMVNETKRLCGRIDHFINTAGVNDSIDSKS